MVQVRLLSSHLPVVSDPHWHLIHSTDWCTRRTVFFRRLDKDFISSAIVCFDKAI